MKTQVFLWQIFCLTLLWDVIVSANIFAYNKPSIKRSIRFYQYPYAEKSEPCVCQQPCLNVSVSIQSTCPCAFQPNGVQPSPLQPTPAQNPLPLSIATTIPLTTTSAPTPTTQVVTTSTTPTITTEVPTPAQNPSTPSIGQGAPLQQQPSQPQQYWCPYPRICTYYQAQRVVPIPIAYQPSMIACYPACVGNAMCLMGTCTCPSSIVYSPTSGCSKMLSPAQMYYRPAYQNALFLCALNKDENCYKAKLLQKV